jgi:antitoxin CptB
MNDDTLKRMRMRAWRRGTREMDLILGPYADACLAGLTPEGLALFEALLDENDHDLYAWITARIGPDAQGPGPVRFAATLDGIAAHAADRLRALS